MRISCRAAIPAPRCLLLCSLLALTQPLGAEDLAGIYDLARQNDAELQGSQFERLALRETLRQSRAGLLPTLRFDAEYGRVGQDIIKSRNQLYTVGKSDYASQNFTLVLNQPLFHYSAIAGVRQARAELGHSDLKVQVTEQSLILRVAGLYFEALAAQDDLDFARAEQVALKAHYDLAYVKHSGGMASVADLYDAGARLAEAEARAIEAESALDDALEALREVCGEWSGDLARLTDGLPMVGLDPPEVDRWIQAALERNLEIRLQQRAIDAARTEIEQQKSNYYPTAELVARESRQYTGKTLFGGGYDLETRDVFLRLSAPLYQGGLVRARVNEATHRYHRARQQEEQQTRTVTRKTRAACFGVTSAINRSTALQQSLASQELALAARQQGFTSGMNSSPEVTDAVRDLFRVKRDYARARYDYVLNSLRLQQAVGTLSEADLVALVQWFEI